MVRLVDVSGISLFTSKGTLIAKGYHAGRTILTDSVETTDEAAFLRFSTDIPTLLSYGEDLAVLAVGADDAKGRAVPTAGSRVTFEMNGPGRIV